MTNEALHIRLSVTRRWCYLPVFWAICLCALTQISLGRDVRLPDWATSLLFRIRVEPPRREGRVSRWLSRRALRSQFRALLRVVHSRSAQPDVRSWALSELLRAGRAIQALR